MVGTTIIRLGHAAAAAAAGDVYGGLQITTSTYIGAYSYHSVAYPGTSLRRLPKFQ